DEKEMPSMKTLGIVGGIGPESTVDYYRSLIQLWRDQTKDGSAPSILLNSIDLKKWLHMLSANELTAATAYASEEMQKLARAGAVAGDRRASCQAGAGARLDSSRHRAAVDFAGRELQHPISRYGSDSRKGRAEAAVVLTRRAQAARVRSLPFL